MLRASRWIKNGWFYIYDKYTPWLNKESTSKAEAWIDILLMVNHSDNKVPGKNELINL